MKKYTPVICTSILMEKPAAIRTSKRGRKSTAEKGEILSIREKEVLCHLRKGNTYALIAIDLRISVETVRAHAHKIYSKLEVKNRTQAINKFY